MMGYVVARMDAGKKIQLVVREARVISAVDVVVISELRPRNWKRIVAGSTKTALRLARAGLGQQMFGVGPWLGVISSGSSGSISLERLS